MKERRLLLVAGYETRPADTEAKKDRDLAATLMSLKTVIQKA